MFDLGWTELVMIVVLAIIIVGPKDLPKVIRTVSRYAGTARAYARDFQRSIESAAEMEELNEIKKEIEEANKELETAGKVGFEDLAAEHEAIRKGFKGLAKSQDSDDGEPTAAPAEAEKPAQAEKPARADTPTETTTTPVGQSASDAGSGPDIKEPPSEGTADVTVEPAKTQTGS